MSSNGGHADEKLVRHVLRYFLNNPQSADSLEGVARWRLLEETIHHTLTETRSALERLVAEGYLQVVSMPGSDHIYALNPTKREEGERFLKPAAPTIKPKS
jgi:hypothetical protein